MNKVEPLKEQHSTAKAIVTNIGKRITFHHGRGAWLINRLQKKKNKRPTDCMAGGKENYEYQASVHVLAIRHCAAHLLWVLAGAWENEQRLKINKMVMVAGLSIEKHKLGSAVGFTEEHFGRTSAFLAFLIPHIIYKQHQATLIMTNTERFCQSDFLSLFNFHESIFILHGFW